MTDPRVEAAARAIYADVNKGHASEKGWANVLGRWQESYRSNARAALAAADKAATITTEWGVRYSDSGYVSRHLSEGSAREAADTHNAIDKTSWRQAFDMQVVSRTITDWQETPDDHPTA